VRMPHRWHAALCLASVVSRPKSVKTSPPQVT
jgi:hypothetical protein